MKERRGIRRELVRRFANGFPWGAAGVYLVFLLGNLFAVPSPSGGAVRVVSDALAVRWGNPVTAALVQFLWSGLLGAVLAAAGVPFLAERRTALWSGLHLLLTAAVFSLAGWRCGWFPYVETWLCLLGLLLLCYVLMWAVRWIGWRQDLRLLRRSAGLPPEGGPRKDAAGNAENLPADGGLSEPAPGIPPESQAVPRERQMLSYLGLAAVVELALPWLLRAVDARDVPLLTGILYPFLILPLFCCVSAYAAGRRCRWPGVLFYALACGLLAVPNVFLLYNSSALFHVWTAGTTALLGGLLGCLRRKIKS